MVALVLRRFNYQLVGAHMGCDKGFGMEYCAKELVGAQTGHARGQHQLRRHRFDYS